MTPCILIVRDDQSDDSVLCFHARGENPGSTSPHDYVITSPDNLSAREDTEWNSLNYTILAVIELPDPDNLYTTASTWLKMRENIRIHIDEIDVTEGSAPDVTAQDEE